VWLSYTHFQRKQGLIKMTKEQELALVRDYLQLLEKQQKTNLH
jgi:hypothetical protein